MSTEIDIYRHIEEEDRKASKDEAIDNIARDIVSGVIEGHEAVISVLLTDYYLDVDALVLAALRGDPVDDFVLDLSDKLSKSDTIQSLATAIFQQRVAEDQDCD